MFSVTHTCTCRVKVNIIDCNTYVREHVFLIKTVWYSILGKIQIVSAFWT